MYACVADLLHEIRSAKQDLITEDGIGTDMAPLIVAFDDDDVLVGFAQLNVASEELVLQTARLGAVCGLMRSGWHARAFALALEVYIDVDDPHPEQLLRPDLPARFAAGDRAVQEAIVVIFLAEDGRAAQATLPYSVGLGRHVEWLESTVRTGVEPLGAYFSMLDLTLRYVPMVPYPTDVHDDVLTLAIAQEIIEHGFVVGCLGWSDVSARDSATPPPYGAPPPPTV
jgi:hypothetical protein